MKDIFLQLLNMSIVASWMIVGVLVFRFVFKKAPRWIVAMLWCLVGIRLLCPFSIESRFSIIPVQTAVTATENSFAVDTGINTVDSTLSIFLNQAGVTDTPSMDNSRELVSPGFMNALLVIWALGAMLLLLGGLVSCVRLHHTLRDAVRYEGNIYQTERILSPFVFGIFKPTIYVPYRLSAEKLECVIMHEKAHIARKDYLIKPIGYVLFSVYWFNPMVWIAYSMLCKDIEFACDERVIRKLGDAKKRIYSETLLECSVSQGLLHACPVAFAEVGVKERIQNIMSFKKAKRWMLVGAYVAVAAIVVGCMTNPTEVKEETDTEIVQSEAEMPATTEEVMAEETSDKASEKEAVEEKLEELTNEKAKIEETKPEETNQEEASANSASSGTEPILYAIEDEDSGSKAEYVKVTTSDPEGDVYVKVGEGNPALDPTCDECINIMRVIIEPIDGAYTKSSYIYNDKKYVVYAVPEGTSIMACCDGTITAVGSDTTNGNYIEITHADGWKAYYSHCKDVNVNEGDKVKTGDVIATVGSTGKATGPCLRFAVSTSDGTFITIEEKLD